jgi:hypothetical protein
MQGPINEHTIRTLARYEGSDIKSLQRFCRKTSLTYSIQIQQRTAIMWEEIEFFYAISNVKLCKFLYIFFFLQKQNLLSRCTSIASVWDSQNIGAAQFSLSNNFKVKVCNIWIVFAVTILYPNISQISLSILQAESLLQNFAWLPE